MVMPILSRRGAVEPFHAMDVLAEANRLRAAGRRSCRWRSASLPIPRPAGARGRGRGRSRSARSAIPMRSGSPALREAIARHYARTLRRRRAGRRGSR